MAEIATTVAAQREFTIRTIDSASIDTVIIDTVIITALTIALITPAQVSPGTIDMDIVTEVIIIDLQLREMDTMLVRIAREMDIS